MFVCPSVCLSVNPPLRLVCFGQLLGLRYADKRICRRETPTMYDTRADPEGGSKGSGPL